MVECDHELTLRSRPVRRYHQDWRVSTPPDGVGTLACANASVLTHEGKRPPDHSGATGLSVSTATTTSRTQAGPDARPERKASTLVGRSCGAATSNSRSE